MQVNNKASSPAWNSGAAGGHYAIKGNDNSDANNNKTIPLAPQVWIALYNFACPVSAYKIAIQIGAIPIKVEAILDKYYDNGKCGRYTEGGISYYYIPRGQR